MRIFVLPQTFDPNSKILTLEGKDYNYIVNVLRLNEGKSLTGRDRNGNIWSLTIEKIENKACTLKAEPQKEAFETTDTLPQDRPQHNIILYQCLPKGRKADDIIRKATEIGARQIVLVKSKNCVADLEGKEKSRLTRYDTIVKEAVQQSGSIIPTTVEGVLDISEVADDFTKRCEQLKTPGIGLLLHQCKLEKDQSNMVKVLENFKGTVGILVGSEGGFTEEECQALLDKKFKAILLKTNILRCETAAIYALAAVQTLLETPCA